MLYSPTDYSCFMVFQMYYFFANSLVIYVVAVVFSSLFQLPFLGIERAMLAKTKREIMMMGRNPLDEMAQAGLAEGGPIDVKNPVQNHVIPYSGSVDDLPQYNNEDSPQHVDLQRTISHTSQL